MRELTSALTLVALSLVTGCKSRDEAASPSTSSASGSGPAAIKTVRPVKAALLRWVEQPGAVQPDEETHLYARIPGFVERLHADTGTEVKKAGQVLAELAVPELVKEEKQKEALVHQADQELTLANRNKLSAVAELQAVKALVDEARAGEKRAQALNDRWQSEAARVNELVKRGVIDEQTRDETLNQAKAAAAALEEARARIQAASRRAEKTKTDVERAEADIAVARARTELGSHWDRPQLPPSAGSCWIIFAQEQPPRWPALRDAFLLPLQWQPNTTDSPSLPGKLRDLARAVARTVHQPTWGLHLSKDAGLEGMDLRAIDEFLEVASGWAPLAGGLLLAAAGGRPDPAVWATGAWGEDGGIRPVSHLKAKVQLAVEYGLRQLFVPQSQVPEAEQIARQQNSSLQVSALAEGRREPQDALRNYRNSLDLPPLPTDPQESRRDYYLRQPDDERARQYYRDNLLPDIVQSLRTQWREQNGGAATHLVTIVSDNPELVSMAVEVVRPRTCLVLCTRDKAAKLAEAQQLLTRNKTECELIPKEYASLEQLLAEMSRAVQEFVAGSDPAGVILDLTPGNKEMSLTLALEVAQAGNRLYYVRHQRQGNRVVPFSERLLVRQVGEKGKRVG